MFDLDDESKFIPDYEEELPPDRIPGSTISKKGRKCPACVGKFTHVRRHVIQEHLPWFVYPKTACWECNLAFGQDRMLSVHITGEHGGKTSNTKYNYSVHGRRWAQMMTQYLNKFGNVNDVVQLINSNEKFKSCEGAVWQEEDRSQITYFLHNSENSNLAISENPYPAKNVSSLLHWKILCILDTCKTSVPSEPASISIPEVTLTPSPKSVYIIGSSIIFWAEQRAISLNTQTDLKE